jgi:splicing factor 3B subunit 2
LYRYYEGKEFETSLKEKKPGDLSPDLVEALSIPPLAPPPWLISMQRFGPPPSYPTLRIPGLNSPIPEGAQWGFHPGGWGKPPLDEYNRPLYGDVFGVLPKANADEGGEPINKEPWGELEPEEEEDEESEEESEEDEEEMDTTGPADGLQTPSGLETPSGMASVVSTVAGGLETPDFLELRKGSRGQEREDESRGPRSLYHVVPEKQAKVRGLMGSERGYDVSAVSGSGAHVPVLGEERTKVCNILIPTSLDVLTWPAEKERRRGLHRRLRTRRPLRRRPPQAVRRGEQGQRRCTWRRTGGRLLGSGGEGECEAEAEDGQGQGEGQG